MTTGLNVLGGTNGTFSFAIANPSGLIPYGKPSVVSAGSNGVQHFQSRPDLEPPSITVTKDTAPASAGDIFVAPRDGPLQNGPLILDPHGKVVWFLPYPVSEKLAITNFRVQNLFGQPVLTWWVGNTDAGYGRGRGSHLQPQLPADRDRARRQRPRRGLARIPRDSPGRRVHHRCLARAPSRRAAGDGRLGRAGDRHQHRPRAVRVAFARPHPAQRVVHEGSAQRAV